MLTAMRIWRKMWTNERVVLTVRSDSRTSLTLINELKAKGGGLAVIASEMALDISESTFEPDLAQHTPGVCNTVADALSRRYDPAWTQTWKLPECLRHAKCCTPPCRDHAWWLSLSPPEVQR